MKIHVPIDVQKVVPQSGRSFLAVNYCNPYFSAPLHIHEEYELILIEQGSGLSLVGDGIMKLNIGDFMLIGQNLPHLWLSTDEYYVPETTLRSRSVYSQFGAKLFPSDGASIPEMANICLLLKESERGLYFTHGGELGPVIEKFRELPFKEGLEQLLLLYDILNQLAADCSYTYIASEKYKNKEDKYEEKEAIKKIIKYVNNHYQDQLSLKSIANEVGMNESSLCRYFKNTTGRRLFDYICELRINYATKLLINTNVSIKRIAYDCGYNHISYFNKQFKSLKNSTPGQFRKLYKREKPSKGNPI